MSEKNIPRQPSWLAKLGEDWLSVIIGLGLVVLAWMGIITKVPWPLFGFLK